MLRLLIYLFLRRVNRVRLGYLQEQETEHWFAANLPALCFHNYLSMVWKLMENLDVAACIHVERQKDEKIRSILRSSRDYLSAGVHWRVNFTGASIAETEKKY